MDMYLVKGRPDRISHLQRPRICLTERETDTESTSIDIQSVINQYQSISNGNHDNAIINKRNIFKRATLMPNIMSQCPSEIPLLHTSPRLFKASRQKSSETRKEKRSSDKLKEAVREQIHPEKKNIDKIGK